ncbi:MAG: prenyltransferase [Bacteroidetes bacterium]|nr:MAG: prenyltransferase [Bacteroidota bacterium]
MSQLSEVNWRNALIIFFVLHILVYPSSNGYNSYMDQDETPIGGLKNPMKPTKQLFFITIVIDVIAIAASFAISLYFATGVLLYILASRAYSYRGIRLKKYPVVGYLTVVLFQGALVFLISYHGSSTNKTLNIPLTPMLAAACLIGGYYPLTQIYQHDDDRKDGILTISMLLGKRGTFLFCGGIFVAATLLMFMTFYSEDRLEAFYIFLGCMLPMLLFFGNWMNKVWRNEAEANFRNSLRMNILASSCTAICFLTLLILRSVE